MDVSDGLAGDLAKMMRASGVGALIEADRVPLSAAAAKAVQASPDLLDLALTGGDDYEILCTVPEKNLDSFRKEADRVGITLSVIGRVVSGHDLPVFRINGLERRYDVGSYQHF
jgi:thiamine-monophosphate kinase